MKKLLILLIVNTLSTGMVPVTFHLTTLQQKLNEYKPKKQESHKIKTDVDSLNKLKELQEEKNKLKALQEENNKLSEGINLWSIYSRELRDENEELKRFTVGILKEKQKLLTEKEELKEYIKILENRLTDVKIPKKQEDTLKEKNSILITTCETIQGKFLDTKQELFNTKQELLNTNQEKKELYNEYKQFLKITKVKNFILDKINYWYFVFENTNLIEDTLKEKFKEKLNKIEYKTLRINPTEKEQLESAKKDITSALKQVTEFETELNKYLTDNKFDLNDNQLQNKYLESNKFRIEK